MSNEIKRGQAWTEKAISDVFVGVEFKKKWYENRNRHENQDNGDYMLRGVFEGKGKIEFIVSEDFLEDILNTPDLQKKTPSLIQKYFETWRLTPDKKHKFEIFEKFLK